MLNSPCMFQGNMTSRDMCFPITMSFGCYNYYITPTPSEVHVYACFWNCSCPREYNYFTDYDIQGYAFPLMTTSFMRTAKVCTL